jgi:predicted  nucleic acid-binding Zn-ribbon protein
MNVEDATSWTQLAINFAVLAGAAFAFWNFLIAPLDKRIKREHEEREKELDQERSARKAADAHRDERTRDITREMTTAIGRVEMLERRMERSEDDRKSLHSEVDEIRAIQQSESNRLRQAEISYERSMGEIRTQMAQMESKLEQSIRNAIREAAKMHPRDRE